MFISTVVLLNIFVFVVLLQSKISVLLCSFVYFIFGLSLTSMCLNAITVSTNSKILKDYFVFEGRGNRSDYFTCCENEMHFSIFHSNTFFWFCVPLGKVDELISTSNS